MIHEIERAFNAARYEHDFNSPFYGYIWKSFSEWNSDNNTSKEAESLCLKAFNDSRLYNTQFGYKFTDWAEYLQHLKSIMQIRYTDSKF